jgi:hypothetical protein
MGLQVLLQLKTPRALRAFVVFDIKVFFCMFVHVAFIFINLITFSAKVLPNSRAIYFGYND